MIPQLAFLKNLKNKNTYKQKILVDKVQNEQEIEKLKQEKEKGIAATTTADSQLNEVKKKLLFVDALRKLLEKLTLTFDSKHVMDSLIDTLKTVLPFNSLSYVVVNHLGNRESSLLYTYSKTPVGRIYFSTV